MRTTIKTGRSGLARRLKSVGESAFESRQGLNVQFCIALGVCAEAPESKQPGIWSDIVVNTKGIGMVQVAEMVKEIQLTSSTNTNVCR